MILEWRRQSKCAGLWKYRTFRHGSVLYWLSPILYFPPPPPPPPFFFFSFFFFFLSFFPRTTVFLAGPHAVCPFGMEDWLNRLRAFIISTVFLIKKKNCKKKLKKSSVASAALSVALLGLPEVDHCEQRIEYRTRNSEASCSIPSLASDCG